MSSCFGFGRKGIRLEDEEALLPKYQDATVMQRRLHQKLHSYQMVRALTRGFMPSNEQLVINIRTLLASDVLNPDTSDLSDSGRLLAKYTKTFVQQFLELLQHKNGRDQIQDFVWFLTKARLSVDTADVQNKASKIKAKADTAAGRMKQSPPEVSTDSFTAYASLQTVGSLLLTNSDFRVFLSDFQKVGRDIFKDSAFALSTAADDAGNKLEQMPSMGEGEGKEKGEQDTNPTNIKPRRGSDLLKQDLDDTSKSSDAPSKDDLDAQTGAVSQILGQEATYVGQQTKQSTKEHLQGDEPQQLLDRLKKAVLRLRQRPDYNDSVSTLTLLIKRYALAYSRAAEHAADAAQEDFSVNDETEHAVKNFWSLVRSFGDTKQWDELEKRWHKFAEHQKRNPEFETFTTEIGNTVQKLLTDPSTFDDASQKIFELRDRLNDAKADSSLRSDVDQLLEQFPPTLQSVAADQDIHNLWNTALKIFNVLSPVHSTTNSDLLQDSLNVFGPLLLQAIQYIPIPRLEISVPEIDLLLENLVFEPGQTINHSSFLPFRFRAETYNDVELRKTHSLRTVAHTKHLVTLKIDGLSIRADELGFWFRAHSGLLRLADQGIAGFSLDDRGIDIHIDMEVGREKLENVLSLRNVRVKVHKLNYQLRQSKLSWLAWLFKPLLRPVLRKVMEKQLASAIADFFHATNRELLFARERLRATRISDPKDLMTFVKAVAARLTPEEDPDLYTRVGVAQPGKGVFKGVYAPGSVVKLWNEEASRASEHIGDEWDRGGWRNEAFDVVAVCP